MVTPRVLILRAPGTNCDEETAHAFALAGGAPERWHVNRVLEEPQRLADFQILCIPGGFSYGDDIAAGRILGNQIRHHLADALQAFRDAGKLILGICNGFQVLLKTELLLPQTIARARRRRWRRTTRATSKTAGCGWRRPAASACFSAACRRDGTAGRARRREVRAAG